MKNGKADNVAITKAIEALYSEVGNFVETNIRSNRKLADIV